MSMSKMNEEIKEILNYLAFFEDIDTQKKVKKVADYITNLQEEIKEILFDMDLIVNHNKVPIYFTQNKVKLLLDYITNLQEENKRLLVELNNNMIERNNYLSRLEKAKEILKDYE